jgi:hypothetical protein
VKTTALTAQCSERLAALARPKKTPVGYRDGYILPKDVPQSALQAHITDRIDTLAKPRYTKSFNMQALWNEKQK